MLSRLLKKDHGASAALGGRLSSTSMMYPPILSQLPDFFSYVAPKGAFYVMARYLFSDEPSQDVASRLLQGARVITIPGGSFGLGGERHLRLSFGGEEAEINEAFDRIERWLDNGY